jgi:hypothetical protein
MITKNVNDILFLTSSHGTISSETRQQARPLAAHTLLPHPWAYLNQIQFLSQA